jgi:hypothetical protein
MLAARAMLSAKPPAIAVAAVAPPGELEEATSIDLDHGCLLGLSSPAQSA